MLFILHQDNVLCGWNISLKGQFCLACLGSSKLRETNLASATSNFPTEIQFSSACNEIRASTGLLCFVASEFQTYLH